MRIRVLDLGEKMTTTIFIGKPAIKKAYTITISERGINKRGRTTSKSINSTSFQVKDFNGDSNLFSLKKKIVMLLK